MAMKNGYLQFVTPRYFFIYKSICFSDVLEGLDHYNDLTH